MPFWDSFKSKNKEEEEKDPQVGRQSYVSMDDESVYTYNTNLQPTVAPTSLLVYIKDPYFHHLPAELLRKNDTHAYVRLTLGDENRFVDMTICPSGEKSVESLLVERDRVVELSDYPNNELPIRNVKETGTIKCEDDMINLPFLHEPGVLYNLRERHALLQPYTKVGNILLALNPFHWIDHLYSLETMDRYTSMLVFKHKKANRRSTISTMEFLADKKEEVEEEEEDVIDPHVFEISARSYHDMIHDQKDQTILVTGESGAGKTESVKLLLQHLTSIMMPTSRSQYNEQENGLYNKIQASNPLFEAFGNASTLHNANSSRFAKFTTLYFELVNNDHRFMKLVGAHHNTYLLEQHRATQHPSNERNFHVFYQLLHSGEKIWQRLKHKDSSSYRYLGYTNTEEEDKSDWKVTYECLLKLIGEESHVIKIMRVICAVLELGNITIASTTDEDVVDLSGGSNRETLRNLKDLLGIPIENMIEALSHRVVEVGSGAQRERLSSPLSLSDAKNNRDALAKVIYSSVFNHIVSKINDSVASGFDCSASYRINILDIFGFESNRVNRFDQFAINYANEALHYKYTMDQFLVITKEYENEGVLSVANLQPPDNSEVMELIEGGIGMINILDEECIRPTGSDPSFVYKSKTMNRENESLMLNPLAKKTEFTIVHYADTLDYDAAGFVESNSDPLAQNLVDMICNCKNDFLVDKFQERKKITGKKGFMTSKTVMSNFRCQLKNLMDTVEKTNVRYIRCIKPNEEMRPQAMDHESTIRQLRCAGVLAALRLSREAFPNKMVHKTFLELFTCLYRSFGNLDELATVSQKVRVDIVLHSLLKSIDTSKLQFDSSPAEVGKTRVYFRKGVLELLEIRRHKILNKNAGILIDFFRAIHARSKYLRLQNSIIKIQAVYRGYMGRYEVKLIMVASSIIQSIFRMKLAQKRIQQLKVCRMEKAARKIQAWWLGRHEFSSFLIMKMSATIIQQFWRTKLGRTKLRTSLHQVVEDARKDKEIHDMQSRLLSVDISDHSAVTQLLLDCSDLLAYSRNEMYALRTTGSELRKLLADEQKLNRELEMQNDMVDAQSVMYGLNARKLEDMNKILSGGANEQKSEVTQLKKRIENMQRQHKSDLVYIENRLKNDLEWKTNDVEKLKKELNEARRLLENETVSLKNQHEIEKSVLKEENKQLADKLASMEEEMLSDRRKLMSLVEEKRSSPEVIGDSTKVNMYESKIEELRSELEDVYMDLERAQRDMRSKEEQHRAQIKAMNRSARVNEEQAMTPFASDIQYLREELQKAHNKEHYMTLELEALHASHEMELATLSRKYDDEKERLKAQAAVRAAAPCKRCDYQKRRMDRKQEVLARARAEIAGEDESTIAEGEVFLKQR